MSRHVFLFDIDGTLLNGGGAGLAALCVALGDLFGYYGSTTGISLSGRTDPAILGDLLTLVGVENSHDHRRRLLSAYLGILPNMLRERPGKLLPGVVALLDRLRERDDVAIGLLTGNVRMGAMLKLGHFGLSERFAFGGYGDDHTDRDDVARTALIDAKRHLGRDPVTTWVIGDTPFDVRCGRAIGANVLGVLTGWHDRNEMQTHCPDVLLDDLGDTDHVMGMLFRNSTDQASRGDFTLRGESGRER